MANERKTAPLLMFHFHGGKSFVVDDFPADKFKELTSFAETLTQPALVPNMILQPASSSSTQVTRGSVKKGTKTSRSVQERREHIPWTEAEHRLFLQGLEKHGWGNWRSISRDCVVTRTPAQLASHAQRYQIRQNSKEKKKERKQSSIHDVTHVKNDDISPPQGPIIAGQASGSAAISSGQSTKQAPPTPPSGIYAAPRIEHPIGGHLVSAVGTQVNLSAAGQSAEQAPPISPAGIYSARRIEHPIGGHLVSAVGTQVNLSAAGQSSEQAPPTSPAGIYAAPRIEHPIGGHLVSAVGTQVNLSAAGQSSEQAPPTSPAGIYAAPRIEHPIGGPICNWHSSESYYCWTHGL